MGRKNRMGWDGTEIFETWDGMGRDFSNVGWDGTKNRMGRDGMGRNFLKRGVGWDGTGFFKRGVGWDGTKNRMGWDGFGMNPGRKLDFSFGTVPFNISTYKCCVQDLCKSTLYTSSVSLLILKNLPSFKNYGPLPGVLKSRRPILLNCQGVRGVSVWIMTCVNIVLINRFQFDGGCEHLPILFSLRGYWNCVYCGTYTC